MSLTFGQYIWPQYLSGESWHGTPEALGFSPGWDDFLPPVTYGLSYNHKKKKKIQLSLFYLADHLR